VYEPDSGLVFITWEKLFMHEETMQIYIYYNAYLIEFMSFQLQLCQLEILATKEIWID